jgi:hypothetical protein
MKENTLVFVVKMNRWGDPEMHSYVLGAFTSKLQAEYAAKEEGEYRGGKYEGEVIELELDAWHEKGEWP